MSKKKIFIIAIIFASICLLIGYVYYSNIQYVNRVEKDLVETENYGGTIVINLDANASKSKYCIHIKDTSFNSAVMLSKKPVLVTIFLIDDNGQLVFNKKENWSYEKFGKIRKRIDNLEKYDQDDGDCIKIRNYSSDCYVNMLDLNPIVYECFMINLNIPMGNMLK